MGYIPLKESELVDEETGLGEAPLIYVNRDAGMGASRGNGASLRKMGHFSMISILRQLMAN